MDMKALQKKYDRMQLEYGSKNLNSVFGAGELDSPDLCLVFINPTKKNIATAKEWKGIRAQWLGTKQIWGFLNECGLFDDELYSKIKNMKALDWSPKFCEEVYSDVAKHSLYITNLAKCTQEDARALPDGVFLKYKDLLLREIEIVKPKKIILFGNQVGTLVLDEKVSVSQVRQKEFKLKINNKDYLAYVCYYPVGNGRFNRPKAVCDVKNILKM